MLRNEDLLVQEVDGFMLTNLFDQEICLMSKFLCARIPSAFIVTIKARDPIASDHDELIFVLR